MANEVSRWNDALTKKAILVINMLATLLLTTAEHDEWDIATDLYGINSFL